MLTPTVANCTSFFYPVGNTPALNLTKALPHGIDVNLLLLGCGDARNILHTAFNEAGLPSRKLDFTCNDWDEAILARNILLFSLLLDNKASGNTTWNLFYSLHLEKSDLLVLSGQLKHLLAASESLKTWKASPYGKVLPFCDQATFDDVRATWKSYDEVASADASARSAILQANLKQSTEMKEILLGKNTMILSSMRSAAPVATANYEELLEVGNLFWKSALAEPVGAAKIPNPLFVASLSTHKVLHYGTSPILGYHLATAFVPLTNTSPLKPNPKDDKSKVYAAAKTQFHEWAAACGILLRSKRLVVRSIVGEALAVCQTFQHLVATKETTAGWYRRQFDSRSLSLDPDAYDGKAAAPAAFDAIDTSNLADHVGTLNLLTSALPLLVAQPWASLFTETLIKREDSSKQDFDKLLYGHGPTISLLFGASPVEYWTNATAVSSVDEIMIGLSSGVINQGTGPTQVLSRLTWKQNKLFSGVNASGPLKVDPEALAGLVFNMYLEMFQHENPMKLLAVSKENMAKMIRNTAYTHFHRGTLVSLLRYLKLRLSVSDFDATCRVLIDKISFERSLMFTGNLRQDLSQHMHMQSLFSEVWFQRDLKPNRNLGGFDSWDSVPDIVAVSLVVPKDKIARLYEGSNQAKMASPTVRGSLVSGEDAAHAWHNFFDDVHLSFGAIKTTGDRETSEFSVTIEPDPAGWAGDSPLIASFYVPAATLQMERKTAYVRLEVLSSAQSIAVFSKTLGAELKIFQAKIGDESSVFITKHLPGQTRYPTTCEAAGVVAEGVTQPKGETETVFTANLTEKYDRIANITGHVDFLSDKGKNLLADKVALAIEQDSPFTINIVFGKKEHIYPVTFPVPVDVSKAKTRIARKSAYVEVIAPFATPCIDPDSITALTPFIYPVTLSRSLSNTPADLNTPHFNLDRLPIVDLTDKAAIRWITTLLSFQYSTGERALRKQLNGGTSPSVRSNFKESIFSMFVNTTGLQGAQQSGLFALSHTDDDSGFHMLIFVSAVRLDPASATVVLDAAVIPFTMDFVSKLNSFLTILETVEIVSVMVNSDELKLWRSSLPALAERCRTWNHKSSCEYAKKGAVPVSQTPGETCLCSCGHGHLPDKFVGLPEWEEASKYATRVAISPTFAVPFVDDIIDFGAWNGGGGAPAAAPSQPPRERCTFCNKTAGNSGVDLKKCMRCQRAKYCDANCQKRDWKKHRGECVET